MQAFKAPNGAVQKTGRSACKSPVQGKDFDAASKEPGPAVELAPLLKPDQRLNTPRKHEGSYESLWFLESPSSWAVGPECRILPFMWSLGPLLNAVGLQLQPAASGKIKAARENEDARASGLRPVGAWRNFRYIGPMLPIWLNKRMSQIYLK